MNYISSEFDIIHLPLNCSLSENFWLFILSKQWYYTVYNEMFSIFIKKKILLAL